MIGLFKAVFFGVFGLVVALILMALVFGKRVRKQWDYEAEFRDEKGREFGEFDIESSRIEKKEADYTVKAKLRMRHPELTLHRAISVYVDDVLVLEGRVESEGRIMLGKGHLKNSVDSARAGQICRVASGETELFRAELRPD